MTRRSVTAWPVYPWLMGIYPVLYVFSVNVGLIFEQDVWPVLGSMLIGVSFIYVLTYLLTKNVDKAALITMLGVLSFSTYGHVYSLIMINRAVTWLDAWMLPVYMLILIVGSALVIRIRRTENLVRLAPSLNAASLVLIAMTLPRLGVYYQRALTADATPAAAPIEATAVQVPPAENLPDIYYIILDGYPANAQLMRDFDYDNAPFTDALEARGFFVAYDSRSNYDVTLPSMASSVNMRYLDDSDRVAAMQQRDNWMYIRRLITDGEAAAQMKARGYRYLFMMSGYALPSTSADENIDFCADGPIRFTSQANDPSGDAYYKRTFLPLFLNTTILHLLVPSLPSVHFDESYCSLPWESAERVLLSFDELGRIAQDPAPTFTFAHIVKPHAPVVFDRNGGIVNLNGLEYSNDLASRQALRQPFFDQLEFLNERILEMIDTLIANSEVPPIIIIQGDHGSDLGVRTRPGQAPHFEILNAYYFPGKTGCLDDPAIVPVNSFRVVFNCYFDGSYPMLEARHFVAGSGPDRLFTAEEVDMQQWSQDVLNNRLPDAGR